MSKPPFARIPRFQPGDLITADQLNRMLDALEALEGRVAALEGKGSPPMPARRILHIGPRRARLAAAEALAGALGRTLFRVDLARIVSKYIGETEKHLESAFAAAEDAGAILLLDEADALFGKRSEVKDAHDRYANIEVAWLLQRLERFCGLAVLALEHGDEIDPAVARHFDAMIRFPD